MRGTACSFAPPEVVMMRTAKRETVAPCAQNVFFVLLLLLLEANQLSLFLYATWCFCWGFLCSLLYRRASFSGSVRLATKS